MSWLKDKIRTWLEIKEDVSPKAFVIHQNEDFETTCIVNKIWYRGDASELSELHKQLNGKQNSFWGSVPTAGMEIKKSHSGLPKLIIKSLTDIIIDNYNGVEMDSEDEWQAIADDNKFDEMLKKAISECLAIGDGAIRVSFDANISEMPILEWFSGDKVDFNYERGRLREIVFKHWYTENRKSYLLKEYRGYGYVNYKLFDDENEVPLKTIQATANLKPITFDKSVMWAVPLMIDKSIKFEGRGASKFDGKYDAFDSLDEVVSQWIEAIRLGRTKTYIPKMLIPRDENTGMLLKPNPYDNQYIQTEDDMSENGGNKVQVEQADIPSDKYLETYMTYLDLCLQGLISPSTLGIDTKKIQDANAQYERQMEKTTLYTRQGIIEALNVFIPEAINMTLKAVDIMRGSSPREDVDVDVLFGEYSTPSFDAQIETITKATTGGIMSLETAIDELYGDSKDDDWKLEELARLKNEQGFQEMEEPAVNQDLGLQEVEEEVDEEV